MLSGRMFPVRARDSSLVMMEAPFAVRLRHVLEEMLPCPATSKIIAVTYIVGIKKVRVYDI